MVHMALQLSSETLPVGQDSLYDARLPISDSALNYDS
jgi:hypothetical protein